MRRLNCAFVVRIWHKTHYLMAWLNSFPYAACDIRIARSLDHYIITRVTSWLTLVLITSLICIITLLCVVVYWTSLRAAIAKRDNINIVLFSSLWDITPPKTQHGKRTNVCPSRWAPGYCTQTNKQTNILRRVCLIIMTKHRHCFCLFTCNMMPARWWYKKGVTTWRWGNVILVLSKCDNELIWLDLSKLIRMIAKRVWWLKTLLYHWRCLGRVVSQAYITDL